MNTTTAKQYDVEVWEVRTHRYTIDAATAKEARIKALNAGGWPSGIVRREVKSARVVR